MGNGQDEAGKEEQGRESNELFEYALEQINMRKTKGLMEKLSSGEEQEGRTKKGKSKWGRALKKSHERKGNV